MSLFHFQGFETAHKPRTSIGPKSLFVLVKRREVVTGFARVVVTTEGLRSNEGSARGVTATSR